jgi:membrane protease subunit HflK
LSNTDTVMVDVKGGNNLLYLPLDRLAGKQRTQVQSSSPNVSANDGQQPSRVVNRNVRTSSRGRDVRGR